jgi:hypothetical protein
MRVLSISSDEGFAAVVWEQLGIGVAETVKKIEESGNNYWEFEEGCFATLLKFDFEVTGSSQFSEFIAWIKNTVCDYDSLKDNDFYLVD